MSTALYAPGCEDIDPARAIRQSGLKLAETSLYHCWREQYASSRVERRSEALELGTLKHCLVLEPAEFERRYRVEPKATRSSLDGLAALIEFYGALCDWSGDTPAGLGPRREVLTQLESAVPADIRIVDVAMLEKAHAVQRAVLSKPRAAALFRMPGILTEQQLVWRDPETDAPCQGTLDILIPPCDALPYGAIIDLKSTRDASARGFIGGKHAAPAQAWRWSQVAKLRMHWQASFYSIGVMQVFETMHPPLYGWIAVEDPATQETVGLYEAAPWMLELGRREYLPYMDTIQEALATGVWPGYGEDFVTPAAPAWMEEL